MGLELFVASRLVRRRGTPLLRTSAVAALAAVVLGTASLVVALALMQGYREALQRGILAAGGHIVAVLPGGVSSDERARFEPRLAALPGVEKVTEVDYLVGLIAASAGGASEAVTVKATGTPPRFAGLPPSGDGPLEIAVGAGLARRLGVTTGATVSLQLATHRGSPVQMPARLAAVYRTGFAEVDDQWAVARLDEVRRRTSGIGTRGIELWLHDPDRSEALRSDVEAVFGGRALVTTWQENNRSLFAALRWQTISLALVLSLVLGVGAFEVSSALVVLVTEKRRELGVLLALGSQPATVRRVLLLAGGFLGLAGVAAGLVVGVGIAFTLTALGVPSFPPDIAAIYMVDRIPLRVMPADLALVLVLGLVEVLVAALWPAHRAATRDPVEVLRWV